MKSLLGGVTTLIRDQVPVPYTSTSGGGLFSMFHSSSGSGGNAEAQMKAMGAVGTLFAIVNRLSTGVSLVEWRLYRKNIDGRRKIGPAEDNRVEVTRHAALDLWNTPNPFTTRQELVEGGQQHIDLTGEGWLIISYLDAGHKVPGELWLVRPDKMAPVQSATKYISGYVYTGPDGEEIPFDRDEVCFIRMPNPLDPFRGMGPVQSILADLDATKYSAEWNRNFFLNSAEPGGVIQVDTTLSDDDFRRMQMRWDEQHRGVSKAHRVAVLEQGKWVPNAFSQKDMQFVELRTASRDTIMEAFAFPKSMLGVTEDVNRANAETGEEIFGRWQQVPRLERWKSMLNNDLLPRFGATSQGVEFDYDNPVPPNTEQINADLTAKATAAKTLTDAGYDADAVLETVGLPPMDHTARPVVTIQPGQSAPDPSAPSVPKEAPASPDGGGTPAARATLDSFVDLLRDHMAGAAGTDIAARQDSPASGVDLGPVAESYQHHLDHLLAAWATIKAAQVDQLADQIRDLIEANNAAGLPSMTVDTDDARDALEEAMTAIGSDAADQVVDEARAQGVTVTPVQPKNSTLRTAATVIAALLGRSLVSSAANEAMRHNSAAATPSAVADAVRTHLESLTDAQPALQLGSGLHQAQHAARVATFDGAENAPESKTGASSVEYYASEVNDTNTCGPCASEDGTDLGGTVQDAEQDYPTGGYVDCDGRDRCRGHIVAVWTIGDNAP